jgi:murein L,D-transpeptidase YafK
VLGTGSGSRSEVALVLAVRQDRAPLLWKQKTRGMFSKYGSPACNLCVNQTFCFSVGGSTW